MKRSHFLALAAALIASVAFSAPSQAGSTLVTTTAFFSITPSGGTTTEIDFFYQDSGGAALSSLSSVSVLNTGGLGSLTSTIIGTDEVKFTFTAANSTTGTIGPPPTPGLQFTFDTGNAPSNVFLKEMNVITTPTNSIAQSVAVTASAVPEPASFALLGIGMTGFLAFRRYFRRNSTTA